MVGGSVIIAACFWIIPLLGNKEPVFSYKLFKTGNGWGYDIMVNDTLQVHQDCIPVITERKGFPKQEQAVQAAALVIEKMKAGKSPAISRAELETICPANE